MKGVNQKRVDLDEDTVNKAEEIRKILGLKTRKDAVENAIDIAQMILEQMKQGAEIRAIHEKRHKCMFIISPGLNTP